MQVLYLQQHCGMTPEQVGDLLNSQSGFKGFTGHADLREVLKLQGEGDGKADLSIQVHFVAGLRLATGVQN